MSTAGVGRGRGVANRVLRRARTRARATLLHEVEKRPGSVARLLHSVRRVRPRRFRSTLYRSVSWPLVQALALRLQVDSIGGRMEVDTGDTVGSVIAVSGVWEPHVTAVARALLRPGDVFVDVGAHVGYYTLLGASVVGERGHVYAFEPSQARVAEIRANLERNGLENVTLLQLAAGSAEGTVTLYEAPRPNTGASTVLERALDPAVPAAEYSTPRVGLARVDRCIARAHLERVRVVKVDVEGYEDEVLSGLDGVFGARQPLCLLVETSPEWSAADPSRYLGELCRLHGLVPWRIRNEYTLEGYFPHSPEPPVRLDAIPATRADLALVRGFGLSLR